MTISHLLAEFSPSRATGSAARLLTELEIEEERLASFEQGYSAGWDDSQKSVGEQRSQILDKLTQTLDDLSFGYHEAHQEILGNLRPVFDAILEIMLPGALRTTLGGMLAEQLEHFASELTNAPLEVSVSQGFDQELRSAIQSVSSLPVRLIEDGRLAPGAIAVRVGEAERVLEPNRLHDELNAIFDAFFSNTDRQVVHE